MSVVPYFFVRCVMTDLAAVQANVQEVWRLEFSPVSREVYPALNEAEPGQAWFCADTGVGAFDEPLESEIAKRLVADPKVLDLRISTDSSLPDYMETVDSMHRLVTKSPFEFQGRTWMVDERGIPLLDRDGKPRPGLDFKHQRMALLAQAFNAADMWMTDEQWEAVDKWMPFARLGGMK